MKPRNCLLMIIGLFACMLQAGAQTSFILSTNCSLSSGNGTYRNTPYAVTAFMNTDGRVDLVTANQDFNTLTVLTNDGSGNFGSNATYAVGIGPGSVAAADVNGDGYVDLICGNLGTNTLTVLTNDGTGNFVIASSPSVGLSPFSVVAADVNGDGHVDLICGSVNGMIVLTNDGIGNFGSNATYAADNYIVQSVTTADVNGDGKVDLISANFFPSGTLSILTNNGGGGFALSSSPVVGSDPASVAAADVNGDGRVDLITANYNGGLTVLTNNGSGGFVLETNITAGIRPVYVSAMDVNGDGKMDLICANQGAPNNSSLMVFTNNGSGGFALATNIAMGTGEANWIAAADFNGDGKVDFASGNRRSNSVSVFFNTSIIPAPTSTPPLTIQPSGNGISVSWPSASAGWLLQQNFDLTTTNWGASGYNGYLIADNGTNKSLTFPFTVRNLFFRLLHP